MEEASVYNSQLRETAKELFSDPAQLKNLPPCREFARMFVSTRWETTGMIMFLSCGMWNCVKCGPKKKAEWYHRILRYFEETPYIEKQLVEPAKWGALHKALNRAGARHIKMRLVTGFFLVFSDTKMGGEAVLGSSRKAVLIQTLQRTKFSKRPISLSWKLSKTTQKPETNKYWKPLDRLHPDLSTYEACAEKLKKIEKTYGVAWSHHSVCGPDGKTLDTIVFSVLEPHNWYRVVWAMSACTRDKNDPRRASPPVAA